MLSTLAQMGICNNPYQNQAMSGAQYNQAAIFGTTINKDRTAELEAAIAYHKNQIDRFNEELEKIKMNTPIPGPTLDELSKFETLKNAWNEYRSIRKLLGLK